MFTVKVFRASVETFFVFFAFLGGRFLIAERGSEDTRAVLNEEFHHGQIVARSGTMQRGPVPNISYNIWLDLIRNMIIRARIYMHL